jgi:hypothetical protein
MRNFKRVLALFTLLVASVALAGPVSAATIPALNLTPGLPDIESSFITVDYVGNSNTGILTASGFANRLTPPGSPSGNIAGGFFDINASINENAMTANGSLTIGGTIVSLGFNSGTLLTGSLADFGAGANDPLEFLFNITGGDAAGLFGPQAGVILSQSGYSGSFAANFSSGAFLGLSDTFSASVNPVPVPAAIWLFGTALIGLVGFGKRMKAA